MTPKATSSIGTNEVKAERRNVIVKKHRGLHPKDVRSTRPLIPVQIPKENGPDVYGTLNDHSDYSEYAWAFLRRNRYYQLMVDEQALDEAWKYVPAQSNHEAGYGLLRRKHYFEPYSEGLPVQWRGIHDFSHDLRHLSGKMKAPRQASDHHVDSERAVWFDTAELLGPGCTALQIQAELVRAKLAHENGDAIPPPFMRPYGPDKGLLRAQLRIADLLSQPKRLMLADDPELGRDRQAFRQNALKALRDAYTPEEPVTTKQIAPLIPSYDMKRVAAASSTLTGPDEKQQLSRASELVRLAWDYIYRWGLLGLLQYDDWVAELADSMGILTDHYDKKAVQKPSSLPTANRRPSIPAESSLDC